MIKLSLAEMWEMFLIFCMILGVGGFLGGLYVDLYVGTPWQALMLFYAGWVLQRMYMGEKREALVVMYSGVALVLLWLDLVVWDLPMPITAALFGVFVLLNLLYIAMNSVPWLFADSEMFGERVDREYSRSELESGQRAPDY